MLSIHAVADQDVIAIAAAAAKLHPAIKRLLSSASVVIDGKKLSVADLDRQLASTRLSITERLTLKVGLERAGLLI